MARILMLLLVLIAFSVCFVGAVVQPDYGILNHPPMCSCSSFSSCERKVYISSDPSDKQIIVMSDAKKAKSYEYWHWDAISTVLSGGGADKDLMCYTHMKGKQYGFTAKLTGFMDMKNVSDLVWIANTVRDARNHFADYIVFDLLDVLFEENLNATLLAHFIQKLTYSINVNSLGTKLMCLLPWKPDTLGGDDATHKMVLDSMIAHCHKFVTGSRSYLAPFKEGCKARATIPLTKLVYGSDEYLTQGIPNKAMFLGVPWHGFDFTCETYLNKTNTCTLKTVMNGTKCDYEGNSVKRGLGEMRKLWPEPLQSVMKHKWQRYTMAPFFTYEDGKKTHQVWFEDIHSLKLKYYLSKDLDMGGVVIWYAEDLTPDTDPLSAVYNKMMWDLLKESMFKPHQRSNYGDQLRSFPSKMAGVGVGCMLLGTIIGFVIGAVVCSRRRSISLKPPFLKDHPQEYHDEDARM